MSSSCFKCSQNDREAKILRCGHNICQDCMPIIKFSEQITIVCSLCSIMSLIHSNQLPIEENPENYLVCIDCRSQIMSTRTFLSSVHRVHNVVSVDKVAHNVNKNIKKYEISFGLQNQALYSQIQSLSRQKRKITQQYSKNCVQMRNFYELLRNKINECQQESNSIYERMVLDIVGEVDTKIRQIKMKIQKCESLIECINYSLTNQISNKSLFVSQFFFKNYNFMDSLMDQLIEARRQTLRRDQQNIKILSPNLGGIKQIIQRVENVNNQMWGKQQEKKSILFATNPQNELEAYFENKRKQIFSNSKNYQECNIKQNQNNNTQNSSQQKFRKINRIINSSSTNNQTYTYNIDARIQNLRKALQLNEKNKITKSTLTLREIKK